MTASHQTTAAVLVLVASGGYLRPSEARNLRVADLFKPAKGRNPGLQFWVLNVADFEAQVPTKTLTYDESIVLDSPDWLGPILAPTAQGRPSSAPLFEIEETARRRAWSDAVQQLGLPARACLYQRRHGGTAGDTLSRRRTSPMEVIMRGRWATLRSVRRSAKPAQVQKFLATLSPASRRYCAAAEKLLKDIVGGRRPAPMLRLCGS